MTDWAAQPASGPTWSGAPGPQVQPPTRPMWNPVEEARKKAELAMAAAGANGSAGAATARPGGSKAPHHTLTPRLMVLIALVGAAPALFGNQLLVLSGEAADVQGRIEYTPLGRWLWIGVVGGSVGLYLAGWVWWTAAAGTNARHKSPKAGSASVAPVAHGCVVLLAVAVGVTSEDEALRGLTIGLSVALAAAWAFAQFGVLMLFARKADAIKSPREPWSRMLWLPFAAMFLFRFSESMSVRLVQPLVATAGALVFLALMLWYLVSIASAMQSFDEACRTPSFGRGDGEVPDFMRMAMMGR